MSTPISRRHFLAGAGPALASAAQRPNILFIMADEMRWDAMGCERHPVVETPNLDRLARQGVRFSRAYTVSPVCSPARASVFTGRYPHVNGVVVNGVPANDGEIFLPSILKHYGYDTAMAGKLHYRPRRFSFGFDRFWTYTNEGPTPELGYMEHMRRKYGSPNMYPRVESTRPFPGDELGGDGGRFAHAAEDFETEWTTERSIEYLRSRRDSDRPWFLFTSFQKPHSPSVEPEPWFSKYDPARVPVPKLPADAREMRARQPAGFRKYWVDDERMMRVMRALYYGAVTHIDSLVGRLLDELEKLHMAHNTLVLFTSDHGNMLGDRGRWYKTLQYEGSAHVPLLWRAPGEKGGRAVNQVVENTDLLPSILETAGIPVPEGVQGRSFTSLARGAGAVWKNRCFSQLGSSMLVEGDWKLIDNSRSGAGPFELYDLRNDPKEERNLAGEARQRGRVEAGIRRMAVWRAERPAPVRIAGMSMPDYVQMSAQERREALREAGSPAAPLPKELEIR